MGSVGADHTPLQDTVGGVGWMLQQPGSPDITTEFYSQLARLGKTIATVSNNDLVKYPDINQRQSALDPLRNALICSAGFWPTAWMVMRQNDRCSIIKIWENYSGRYNE
jgi:hypothetical protein